MWSIVVVPVTVDDAWVWPILVVPLTALATLVPVTPVTALAMLVPVTPVTALATLVPVTPVTALAMLVPVTPVTALAMLVPVTPVTALAMLVPVTPVTALAAFVSPVAAWVWARSTEPELAVSTELAFAKPFTAVAFACTEPTALPVLPPAFEAVRVAAFGSLPAAPSTPRKKRPRRSGK